MVVLDREDVDFLSRMPLFADADPDALAELAAGLKPRTYRRGERIFHGDDPADSLFLLKQGVVKVQLASPDGKHITIAWVRALNFFGTLSCVRSMPRLEKATALEPAEVRLLQQDDFRAFLRKNPETALVFADLLAQRWQAGLEFLQDVTFLDVPGRLAKVFLSRSGPARALLSASGDRASLHVPSQGELAALIGATRESVNKWMQRFVQQGLIECRGKSLRVLDEERLRHYLD